MIGTRRLGDQSLDGREQFMGGDPKAQQCGWLKDRYGVSWQIAPPMEEVFAREDMSPAAERAMEAMLKMKKINLAELRRAAEGSNGGAGRGSRSTEKV